MYKTKETAIRNLEKGEGFHLKKFDLWRDDKDVAKCAIGQFGHNLVCLSDNLKDNSDIVLYAVGSKHNDGGGNIFNYASDKLKDNKEVSIEAIKTRWSSLFYISDRLKNDKETILEACKKEKLDREIQKPLLAIPPKEIEPYSSLQHASQEIQDLCKDKDPIKVLESCILAEKLQDQLSNKQNQAPTKKMKI